MGAIFFSVDRSTVSLLAKTLGLQTFVETGTFKGDSLAVIRDLFTTLYSAEIDPALAAAAQARFSHDAAIAIHNGPSSVMLRGLDGATRDRTFFWLDAHWCDSAGTDPECQCPLLAELEAIGEVGLHSVVAIDDARLFLAPPPAAHIISHWPHFDEILSRLRITAPQHRILVFDDVIWVVPTAAFAPLLDHAAEHGADWLAIAEKARTYDAVLAQLAEKDREIASLSSENQARLDLIGRLQAALDQRSAAESARMATTAAETAIRYSQLEARCLSAEAAAIERNQVIDTLDFAVREANERAERAEHSEELVKAELTRAAATSTESVVRYQELSARVVDIEAVAAERAELIDRLDTTAKNALDRAAVAEDALEHLRSEAAAAATRYDAAVLQVRALEAVAEERAQLIAALDASARAAYERGGAVEEAHRHLLLRVQMLEAAAADLTGQAVTAADRVRELEQVAADRLAAIERLDNVARAAGQRADAIDELARARADSLTHWQATASAAELQLAELTATITGVTGRAESAERECAARMVVIEELVRARDAFAAALAARSWRSRLKRLLF